EPTGASYRAQKEIFLECTGDNGFAPTSAFVHPATGDLYIAIGGRGPRGGGFRVRSVCPGGAPPANTTNPRQKTPPRSHGLSKNQHMASVKSSRRAHRQGPRISDGRWKSSCAFTKSCCRRRLSLRARPCGTRMTEPFEVSLRVCCRRWTPRCLRDSSSRSK